MRLPPEKRQDEVNGANGEKNYQENTKSVDLSVSMKTKLKNDPEMS